MSTVRNENDNLEPTLARPTTEGENRKYMKLVFPLKPGNHQQVFCMPFTYADVGTRVTRWNGWFATWGICYRVSRGGVYTRCRIRCGSKNSGSWVLVLASHLYFETHSYSHSDYQILSGLNRSCEKDWAFAYKCYPKTWSHSQCTIEYSAKSAPFSRSTRTTDSWPWREAVRSALPSAPSDAFLTSAPRFNKIPDERRPNVSKPPEQQQCIIILK